MKRLRRVESTYRVPPERLIVIGMVDVCPVPRCEANGTTHDHVREVVEYYERKGRKR